MGGYVVLFDNWYGLKVTRNVLMYKCFANAALRQLSHFFGWSPFVVAELGVQPALLRTNATFMQLAADSR